MRIQSKVSVQKRPPREVLGSVCVAVRRAGALVGGGVGAVESLRLEACGQRGLSRRLVLFFIEKNQGISYFLTAATVHDNISDFYETVLIKKCIKWAFAADYIIFKFAFKSSRYDKIGFCRIIRAVVVNFSVFFFSCNLGAMFFTQQKIYLYDSSFS